MQRCLRQIGILIILASLPCMEAVASEFRSRPHQWAQPVIGFQLDNLYQVSDELFRSRQPDDDDLRALGKTGMRSVLNLREHHNDSKDGGNNLELHRVPMNAGEIDDAKMEQALIIIANSPKPILVHCWHGSDRTGAVVAMYRMVMQGWPREQAIDEFVNGGYGYHKSFYPNIEKYLETVDLQRFKTAIAARKVKQAAVKH